MDYRAAQKLRISRVVAGDIAFSLGMKGQHASSYIVTGLDKVDPFSVNPFSAYYHHFTRDALQTSRIAVVGVSFGDDHLNSFLTNLPQERKGQSVLVVDFKTAAQVAAFGTAPYGSDVLLLKLAQLTGARFPFDVTAHINKLASDVGSKGFGQFANQITFYAKGTVDFIADAVPKGLL
jgi:hypothetical protein